AMARLTSTMGLDVAPSLLRQSAAPVRISARGGKVRVLSIAEAGSPAIRSAWEQLARDAAEPNPYYEHWFALPSLDQFAEGLGCCLLTHYTGDRLTGLLPIALRKPYYNYPLPHASAWLHDNAFCGAPLVERGQEHAFWAALFNQFDREPGRALFLHLPFLPSEGALTSALDAVLEETQRHGVTVHRMERAMLASDATPEDYFAQSMKPKARKELRRQRKRLEEEGGLTFERQRDERGISDWIGDFLALEAAGWKGDAGSALASSRHTSDFFAAAIEGASRTGKLERLTLRLDGKPIAMLANFVTPPGVYSFKTTFDEAYSRFSPGLQLQIENLDLLERDDIDWADSCAAQGHSMIERIWSEKRRMESRNIAIGGPVRRAIFRGLMAYENRNGSPQ
ncbi:MAG: GNAT family N-acetyltransferase, partial [Pseudomonadota bacterium]